MKKINRTKLIEFPYLSILRNCYANSFIEYITPNFTRIMPLSIGVFHLIVKEIQEYNIKEMYLITLI